MNRIVRIASPMVLSAWAGLVLAQTPTTPNSRTTPGQNPTTAGQSSTPGQNSTPAQNSTSQFPATSASDPLMQAIEMNSAELALAKTAVTKARDSRVKSFAEMMTKDHTEALTKLRNVQSLSSNNVQSGSSGNTQSGASSSTQAGATRNTQSGSSTTTQSGASRNVQTTPTTDVKLSAKHQATADRLSRLSGTEFDREYMDTMVADHREALEFFERESKSSTSASGSGNTSLAKVSQELIPTVRKHLQEAQEIQKELGNNSPSNTTTRPGSNTNRGNNNGNIGTTNPNGSGANPSTGTPSGAAPNR